MSVWLMRAMNDEAAWTASEAEACLFPTWQELPDLSRIGSARELRQLLQKQMPDATPETLTRRTERLWQFLDTIMPGDQIAMVAADGKTLASGEVTGPYQYVMGDARPHRRPMRWVKRSIPLSRFKPELQALCRSPVELQPVEEWGLRNQLARAQGLPTNKRVFYTVVVMVIMFGVRLYPSFIDYMRDLHWIH